MSSIVNKKLFFGTIKKRYLLNKASSNKQTYHIEITFPEEDFTCKVGDSIGILPANDPLIVNKILSCIKAKGDEKIIEKRSKEELSLQDFLLHKVNLTKVSNRLVEFTMNHHSLAEKSLSKEFLSTLHVQDLFFTPYQQKSLQELSDLFLPQLPRFYSIANSLSAHPNEIHLTVKYIQYENNGSIYYGAGSHFLCKLAEIETTPIPFFLLPAKDFTLPEDKTSPVIMIGPGTGIAPFRAFLQERMYQNAEGKNWLFFGEQYQKLDYYYESFFTFLQKENRLRISTAFSRDQSEKVYVQHKLLEHSKEIWDWINNGSYIFVCGDAKKMAREVESTLKSIFQKEGKMKEEEAFSFFLQLKKTKRYSADVY